MKTLNKYLLLLAGGLMSLTSCNDFLDREPLDQVTPDNYLWSEGDLRAYSIKHYSFTTHGDGGLGIWAGDDHTDNQVTASYDSRWTPGEWKVKDHYDHDYDDPWYFNQARECNYFLETVLPRYEAGKITGSADAIKHDIGEIYFLRASYNFDKLQAFGDFPIIKTTLPDEKGALLEATKRQPRHLVARFILEDLDLAISMLSNNPEGGTNRITRNAALLIKSRVALYEASWETYHANTAFVPNGPGWPGGQCEYNKDTEIKFFLDQCKEAASQLADQNLLAENTGWAEGNAKMNNPYFAQFSADNMDGYKEILLWKEYSASEGILHSATFYIRSGGNSGFSRQFVETFLMKNGLPIYAAEANYKGDKSLSDVRADRDERLQLFMMTRNELLSEGESTFVDTLSTLPSILAKAENRCVTGYQLRKGLCAHWSRDWQEGYQGCPVFRATEAYLNYIEASCIENNGNSIDSKAQGYWKQLRERAGLPGDYMITVNATDMEKEAPNDWGTFSHGEKVSKLLYNIRRERRCELMEEGFRMTDLKRWRALDQVKNWMPEGFNLWGSDIHTQYTGLIYDGGNESNVSSPERSNYLRPYEILNKASNLIYGKGYKWTEAHYLSPISIIHFRNSSTEADNVSTSVIYQNPGWPTVADQGPTSN